jgi:hypothetical protein
MPCDLNGKLINILPVVTGEGKNGQWKKQEFLIETTEQYPKKVLFSLWGDKSNLISSYAIGSDLKVSFNPESREYNGRYFTELRAWRIEGASANTNAPANNSGNYNASKSYNNNSMPSSAEDFPTTVSIKDDLPF